MGVQFLSRRRWWLSSSSQRAHPFVNDVEFQGYSVLSAMSRNILTYCDFNQVNGHIRTRGVTTLLASLLWFESGSWTGLAQCAFPTSGMKVSCILETLRDGKRRWWVHIKTGASLLKIDQWIYIYIYVYIYILQKGWVVRPIQMSIVAVLNSAALLLTSWPVMLDSLKKSELKSRK